MSLVRVRYLEGSRQIEEVCTLVARNESTPEEKGSRSSIHIPGQILLEDEFGFWYLDESKLISIVPVAKNEQAENV